MWQSLFSFVSILAMAAWLMLGFLPRNALIKSAIMYLGVAILCLTYTVLFVAVTSGSIDPHLAMGGGAVKPGFGNIEEVRAIFLSDGGVVIGWTHYLAFDLFTGMWIAADADNKGFNRWAMLPVLFATFMAGPIGLFAWLVIREGRARLLGPARSRISIS